MAIHISFATFNIFILMQFQNALKSLDSTVSLRDELRSRTEFTMSHICNFTHFNQNCSIEESSRSGQVNNVHTCETENLTIKIRHNSILTLNCSYSLFGKKVSIPSLSITL